MSFRRRALRALTPAALAIVLAVSSSCRHSTSSTSPSTATGAIAGRVTDATTDQPVPGATVRIDGVGEVANGSDGTFRLDAPSVSAALRSVTVISPTTVDRATWAVVPTTALTLTLMPAALDLGAFNQMFRGNGGELHRWTSAPALVLQRRALRFTNFTDASYVATATVMSDEEADALIADLTWGLPQLTGGTFTGFSTIQRETAVEGESVSIARAGSVIVARSEGLSAATPYAGYTRWAWNASGEMLNGIVLIDRAFDGSTSSLRRAVRAHELGHALGYNHVTARPSVMNAAATVEPNQFDRDGARLAFQRPVQNRSPDIDPMPSGTLPRAKDKADLVGRAVTKSRKQFPASIGS